MRSASLTSRRRLISPTPSRLGGRVCIATQSRLRRASSKTSSQEMTRCPPGMAPASALTIVVFPAWVAPETRMLRPDCTEASRKAATWLVIEPMRTRSLVREAREVCLRMFTAQCWEVIGGMTT